MIIQTNWKMNFEKIESLFKETQFLSNKYNNLFDWRILTHPVGKFDLRKILNNKNFIRYLDKQIKFPMDRSLIEIYKFDKKIFNINDIKTTNSYRLMKLKKENYIKKEKHARYSLTKEGYEYLIGKIFPQWCIYIKKQKYPIQRTIIYRLLSYDGINLPTQKNFSSAFGYTQSWFVNYERAKGVISPLNTKRFMEIIKNKFGKQIEKNFKKDNIKEIYQRLGKNRHKQICKAAKLIHPILRNKLSKEEYRIYQTKRIKNSSLSIYEKKIKQLFENQKICEFEIHPNFKTYHFDFIISNKNSPKIIIEFISSTGINIKKIIKIKNLLPEIITIAIVKDGIKNNYLLRLDYYFDYVFRLSDAKKFISVIKSISKKEKKKETLPKRIFFNIGEKGSSLWQGEAEEKLRGLFIKNNLVENTDFYHELPIFVEFNKNRYKFLSDFIFLDKNKNLKIIIESQTIHSKKRQCLRDKLSRIVNKFDVYKNILKLNVFCIAVIIIKNKNNFYYETQQLKEEGFCDKLFINDEIEQLPSVIRGVLNGG